MGTRITNTMVSQQVLADIMDVSGRLSRTQEKLASGRELTRPSDNPFQTSRALSLSGSLEGTQQ